MSQASQWSLVIKDCWLNSGGVSSIAPRGGGRGAGPLQPVASKDRGEGCAFGEVMGSLRRAKGFKNSLGHMICCHSQAGGLLGSSSDLGSAGADAAVPGCALPWGLWSTQCLAPTLLCGFELVTQPL